MVPAAGALLWALLLSLGSRAAGAEDQTPTPAGLQRVSFRSGGPMASSSRSTSRTSRFPKSRVTLEEVDEEDPMADEDAATADSPAVPAAAELLAASVAKGVTHQPESGEEEGALEHEVEINARKNNSDEESHKMTGMVEGHSGFPANTRPPEIRLTTGLPPASSKSTTDRLVTDVSLNRWSTAGATPNRWSSTSGTAMPPAEELRLVLLPWGPWHCHCKSGTMSRTRAGKLQGLSGRLRAGALSQIRTEHRPCTYQQCPCNREREECPLDADLCPDCKTREQPSYIFSPRPTPSPALAFWKRVRIGLEEIWNSLSSVFTEMQPTEQKQR
ncbi:protein MENT [Choloepus didactylus]|uniref:protein MENT n=1 Tax=Choloepus didactylus TaxID=27675 RepID=UPI0018A02DCC|nr:protein MENT [Choloepus didactylus]